jgi:hypothetical protein
MRPGVHKLETNESLHSILRRAGGLTPDAYVYGAQLPRESARIEEQESLDELVRTMEVQIHQSAGDYLEMAGKGKPASDLHHAFVLRANGVVVAANNVNGVFTGTNFDRLRLYPGDQIVVPYKLPTGAFVHGLRDWTQIASQLAVTGAVIALLP